MAFDRFHILDRLIDIAKAIVIVAKLNSHRILVAWLYVPAGIVLILLACWGVDRLIHLSSVSFPASVALLILLFAALNLGDWLLGERRTRGLVRVIEVPADFALRWINVFFVPAFVLLPLSPSIPGVEVAKIVGVFVIGFFAVFVATAYMVWGLQLLTGTSKRSVVERAEEMGEEKDDIPLAEQPRDTDGLTSASRTPASSSVASLPESPPAAHQLQTSVSSASTASLTQARTQSPLSRLPRQDRPPPTRPQLYAATMSKHLDMLTYAGLLLTVGIPLYYAGISPMPLHLSLTVLAYHAALLLPPTWTRILHPVLVAAALTILLVWPVGLTRHRSLRSTLHAYSTGTRYLQLFTPRHRSAPALPGPGAGDVLSSVLDVSIVSLALPMFRHRRSLRAHFAAIVAPAVVLAAGSLLAYPPLCRAVGIAPERSLAFAVRSLTLALGGPAAVNLGVGPEGSSFVALVCILSGILGALAGPRVLGFIGVAEGDYVTRGVSLGCSSSAIATARLLREDPRAAALSGLSMGLFGAVTVGLTSVPPVVGFVREIAGAA